MNIRLKSYLILLATFSLGITAGVLLAVATMKMTFGAMKGFGPPGMDRPFGHMGPPPGGPGPMLEKHLERIVQPSDAQREKLKPLMEKYQERLGQMMKSHLEAVRFVMDSLDVDLEKMLTPEQLERWKHRPRPPHPPSGPENNPPPRE